MKDEYGGDSVQVEGNIGPNEGRSDYRSMSAHGKRIVYCPFPIVYFIFHVVLVKDELLSIAIIVMLIE